MQLESKDFYKIAAERNGHSFDLIKSIGDAVFRSMSDLQRDPPNLILNIRGLGRRFVRKTKLNEKLDKMEIDYRNIYNGVPLKFGRTKEDVDTDRIILDRLSDLYISFLDKKSRIKIIRRENPQTPTQPDLSPQPVREAGPDHPSECPGLPAGEPSILRQQGIISQTPSLY